VGTPDPDEQRATMIAAWETGAPGWGARADDIRAFGMDVSAWLIDALQLQPGQRVLELAAGPGDTGFMAAELIRPGGTLITSDAAEAMLEVARARAEQLGIDNVEFKRLELEWIDLETASVDAVLCRWGVMLIVDPEAAAHEMRRVVKPGGRLAVAVWDGPERNPWATVPGRALVELGLAEPPDPSAPGMFALAAPGRLEELLAGAGFQDVHVDGVDVRRTNDGLPSYIKETLDLSTPFRRVYEELNDDERTAVADKIAAALGPFSDSEGSIHFPGRTLVASATA
jgi:SAM-dependent methyltransferase